MFLSSYTWVFTLLSFMSSETLREENQVLPVIVHNNDSAAYTYYTTTPISDQTIDSEKVLKRSVISKLLVSTIFASLGAVGIAGNGLVIFAILTEPSLKPEAQLSNLAVMNLAMTDFMTLSLVSVPAAISVVFDGNIFGNFYCGFWAVINATGIVATMGFLTVISLDRFIHVGWYSQYHTFVTHNRMLGANAFVWTYSFVCAIGWTLFNFEYDFWAGICDFTWQNYGPDVPGAFFYGLYCGVVYGITPSIIILICNVAIIQMTKEKVRVETKAQKTIPMECVDMYIVEGFEDEETKTAKQESMKVNARILKAMVLIIVAYFVLTFPVFFIRVIKLLGGANGPAKHIPGWVTLLVTFSQFSGSVVNPLIYGIFRKDFRDAYARIWQRMICG